MNIHIDLQMDRLHIDINTYRCTVAVAQRPHLCSKVKVISLIVFGKLLLFLNTEEGMQLCQRKGEAVTALSLPEFKEHLDNGLWHVLWFLGLSCAGSGVGFDNPGGSFPISIFCDSVIYEEQVY